METNLTVNTGTVGAQVGGAENATENVNGAERSDNNTQTQPEKTYTEAEFKAELDRRTQQAILTAKEKWSEELDGKVKEAKDEGERLAKLSADERAKEEQKKAQEAFEKERSQYMRERLEFETTKQLAELKLPVSFASLLAGADAENNIIGAYDVNGNQQMLSSGCLAGSLPTAATKTANGYIAASVDDMTFVNADGAIIGEADASDLFCITDNTVWIHEMTPLSDGSVLVLAQLSRSGVDGDETVLFKVAGF